MNSIEAEVSRIVSFLQKTYQQQAKKTAVVAVSGGIDSAVSLTLATQALGPTNVHALFLPFADQSSEDAQMVTSFNELPAENQHILPITTLVEAAMATVGADALQQDKVRLGNIQARARMILLYDLAKQLDALVCGTENKSEKYLAYFTRFGDEASDVEPIQHLYKTQVRQLAEYFQLPATIQEKAPSAGLWAGQTDELELGFTYQQADQVMAVYVDEFQLDDTQFSVDSVEGIEPAIVQKVVDRIKSQSFKHQVPYRIVSS